MHEPSASIRALLDRGAESRSLPSREAEEAADYQAFAGGRIGNRTQWTLVFQFASGAVRCFPYAHFDGLRSDQPEAGFSVTFAGVEVEVRGQRLGPLVEAVCQHRAAVIVEASRAQAMRCGTEALVTSIVTRTTRAMRT